jgi:hypothetical protein
MANTVNVAQFGGLQGGHAGDMQVANTNFVSSENVTSAATSAQSAKMSASTRVVRIATDTTVRVAFGTNPTATSTDVRLLADTVEYFGVNPGDKVAVINE